MSTEGSDLHYYVKFIEDTIMDEFGNTMSGEIKEQFENALEGWEAENQDFAQEPDLDMTDFESMRAECQRREPTGKDVVKALNCMRKLDGSLDYTRYLARIDPGGSNRELMDELLQSWEQMLDSRKPTNKELERSANRFISMMKSWLNTVSAIGQGDWSNAWGSAAAQFICGREKDIAKYAKAFRNNKAVHGLTDYLGREEDDTSDGLGVIEGFEGNTKDDHMKEELSGVTVGRDIEGLLPSELSLLMDEDLSIIFDLRFIEGTLMSFAKEGGVKVRESEYGDVKAPEKLGPIILITDRSGSMRGQPSFILKALCFTIITRAAKQNREVFRIDFNVNANKVEMDPKHHMQELLKFLGSCASGGTDPTDALAEALNISEREKYWKADILVMSDFYLDTDAFLRNNHMIESIRKRGCRIHSVSIRKKRMFNSNFDSCWGFGYNMYPNTFQRLENGRIKNDHWKRREP